MHQQARDGGWVTGATLVNLAGVNLHTASSVGGKMMSLENVNL